MDIFRLLTVHLLPNGFPPILHHKTSLHEESHHSSCAAKSHRCIGPPQYGNEAHPADRPPSPKRQNKTVIHFVYFIASIILFLSYIFCISFCNPNFSPRIICIHHREIHQFHFHRVQCVFSSKTWKQRNRKLISTYR